MTKSTKKILIKILIVAVAIAAVCLAIYLPLKLTGSLEKIDSPEKLKEVILNFGAYSYIIYFVLQFLQVTFLPLPSFVTTVAGTLLFGPWITVGLSLGAVWLGSLFAFFLGKKIGRRIVVWVVGESQAVKWEQKLKRGNYVFFLMMLFPVFPDDILCIVAGTIGMSWRFFITTNLITRPIAIITTCFVGSGTLIPYSGWGIPVWIALVIVCAILMLISFKYQPQIEAFVERLGSKISGKDKASKNQSIQTNEQKNPQTETNEEQSKQNDVD
ncbi:MAG: TVP38/TMEM64 family protein [Clostridia bacterium]|nr:TVP38/TMEM64 family protein [Clostridia bacterium]